MSEDNIIDIDAPTKALPTIPQGHWLKRTLDEITPAIEVQPRVDIVDWSDNHVTLPSGSTGGGKWFTRAYQKAILRVSTKPDVVTVNILKCAQIGYSMMLLILLSWNLTVRGVSAAVFQPTDSDIKAWTTSVVRPFIRVNPVIHDQMDADIDTSSKTNNANGIVLKSSASLYLLCLLYTSPSPRDRQKSRMPSSA